MDFNFLKEGKFPVGSRVAFRQEMVSAFIKETTGANPDLKKYQKMVLAGIEQTGSVEGMISMLVNVKYPDGWVVPIHPKYLQPVESQE